jgi:hypothetical protein
LWTNIPPPRVKNSSSNSIFLKAVETNHREQNPPLAAG